MTPDFFQPGSFYRFCGGSGPSPAQQIAAAPVPAPSPPVTQNAAEVIQAEQDTAQQNLMKKSVKRTVWAGDTGSFMPGPGNVAGQPGQAGQTGYKSKLG